MPEIEANGATLHYEETGAGPELVVFLHGALTGSAVFAAQVAAFAPTHRCVTLDFRGHGASAGTDTGYDIDMLANDTMAVLEILGGPAHLVGLCIGGSAAMRIAIRRPSLVRSLTLIATTAEAEPAEHMAQYRLVGFAGRWLGFRHVVRWIMPVLFGPTFMADPARQAERDAWRQRLAANPRISASLALDAAIGRDGITESLHRIRVPTLVIAGAEDTATPPLRSERLAARIPGSRLLVIPEAGHNPTLEQPGAIVAAMAAFLPKPPTRDSAR